MADPTRFLDQALFAQHDRLLKLDTPLGDDILLPQRLLAHERLGRSYEYTIDLVSVRDDIELKMLIAQPVTLWLRQADRSYLPVSAYVHTIKRLGSDGQLTFCQMSIAPWLHFLKFRKDARIWQDKKADDILAEVFSAHPQAAGNFRFELSQPAVSRSYCTQYETDWEFVHRLMEEEGWYGYHEQAEDGSGHVFVVTDSTYQLKPFPSQQIRFHSAGTEDELQEIGHWSTSRNVASYQFTTRTDDYKAPNEQKQCNVTVLTEHGDLPGQLEVYEYTGAYTYSKRDQGDRQARIRVEEWESSMKRFHGVSSVRHLRVGSWFTLEDHPAHQGDPEEDRQFVVIALDWCIENNLPVSGKLRDFPGSLSPQVKAFKTAIGRSDAGSRSNGEEPPGSKDTGHCFNCFEVQRRKVPFRSPAEHTKPDLHPQTAVVVGPAGEEVYTDHLNRVKVRFRWDRQNPGDERASCWVRVSYPNAGQGWGGINVPRIGQEVIVTFLNGDVDLSLIHI